MAAVGQTFAVLTLCALVIAHALGTRAGDIEAVVGHSGPLGPRIKVMAGSDIDTHPRQTDKEEAIKRSVNDRASKLFERLKREMNSLDELTMRGARTAFEQSHFGTEDKRNGPLVGKK